MANHQWLPKSTLSDISYWQYRKYKQYQTDIMQYIVRIPQN